MQGVIHQVSVSRGGVPKLPVLEAVVGELGLEADGHNEPLTVHGGPEHDVCLFAVERIEALAAEGHPVSAGSVGENVTIRGIDWEEVTPGTVIHLGEQVRLEVTRYTTPCSTIRQSFRDRDSNRIHQNLHPGWSRVYAKVLAGGVIRPGDPVRIATRVTG
jgi:MOSC domain-containing protein YiiM